MNITAIMQNYFLQLNHETREHSLRVGRLCEKVGKEMGLHTELLYTIGLLHDIGKLYIDPLILQKPSALTAEERTVINMHSLRGGELLKAHFPNAPHLYFPVMFHHGFVIKKKDFAEEDYNLIYELWNDVVCANDQLKTLTSVVHMTDYVDAMTSKRVYHDAVDLERALLHINKKNPLYNEHIEETIRELFTDLNPDFFSVCDKDIEIGKLSNGIKHASKEIKINA